MMKKSIIQTSIFILILGVLVAFNARNSEQSNAKILYKSSETTENSVSEVKASHILVDTEEEAKKIREEILAGKEFAKAAKESSKCPSGRQGGDLGFFGRGMMVPQFERAAFSLPVGQLSDPVKTQFGWHLIVVTDKK